MLPGFDLKQKPDTDPNVKNNIEYGFDPRKNARIPGKNNVPAFCRAGFLIIPYNSKQKRAC